MPCRSFRSLTLALAVLCAPVAAQAAADEPAAAGAATPAGEAGAPAALEGEEVFVSAERLERSAEERVVVGEGAVTIRHRDVRLVADRAVYHELTKDIVADGNVVFDRGPDRLQGEHLELNLETRVGFMERAQGFVATYYLSGDRIEKRGPDHYALRGGSFTTCEGVLPDWSFSATTIDVTVDEYLHAWNPTLRIKRLPVFYFPYAVFPVKLDRSTGFLIPTVNVTNTDGFILRESFYWAPRDNFDATIGLEYLQKTGWGAVGEMRYLLAPRTQGIMGAYYQRNMDTDARRWALTTRNSQELPWGIQAEVEAFIQSDRDFIKTNGNTIEDRSSERTTSSFYLNRNWSAWQFVLSGRNEKSLITEQETTLTRFPELSIDRTSTQLFGTDLFFKLNAGAVRITRENESEDFSTTRLYIAPEFTWPISLGGVARLIPSAGYGWTRYSRDAEDNEKTRELPYYRVALEGPRPYRIWDLSGGGRIDKIKHLIEPRIAYVYTPEVNQDSLPQFDSIDRVPQANRLEYSLTNTVYAKVRSTAPVPGPAPGSAPAPAPVAGAEGPRFLGGGGSFLALDESVGINAGAEHGEGAPAALPAPPQYTTQELFWLKLSQNYTFAGTAEAEAGRNFSALEWEAHTRPLPVLELWWRGNLDVYGNGIGYQNVALHWIPVSNASVRGEWRSSRDSKQDFLDLGVTYSLGRIGLEGRSRYNYGEDTFVENRINFKYSSQCWDVTVGYVHWTEDYEFTLLVSLKGIGTVVKL
jgi:LPS-assembly protein